MNWLDDIDENLLEEEVKNSEKSFEIESGIYNVAIEEAYITTSDSGSEFLNFRFRTADNRSIFWKSVNTLLKDSDGKKYWEKDGKRHPYGGYVTMAKICDVIDCKLKDLSPIDATLEIFGENQKVKMFKDLIGKKLKIVVQQYEDDYSGEVKIKTDIVGFMDLDGNYKDENLIEKYEKKIKRTPVRELKKNKSNNANNSGSNSW